MFDLRAIIIPILIIRVDYLKKTISIILTFIILLLTVSGCGAKESSSESGTAAAADVRDKSKPAVIDENKTYDYEVKELWCENNGNKIYGQAYIPKIDGKVPLVITSHGLGANHESGASYAKNYAPRGFAVYTFDFCGGSNKNHENKSDGSPLEMSVMTEVSDLEAILKSAKTWDFVDSKHIFLQGGSQGGLVSAITGVKHENEISGLILLYPAFGMYDFVTGYFAPENIPDEYDISSMTVGRKFFTDFQDYDVREYLPEFDKPVTIIQGGADGIVLPSSSYAAHESLPDSEYHEIEGAGHGFSGEYHKQASDTAIKFLFKNIK